MWEQVVNIEVRDELVTYSVSFNLYSGESTEAPIAYVLCAAWISGWWWW